MTALQRVASAGAGASGRGLLRGRVHQNLWLEMLVAATAASALMAVVAGVVVLRHEAGHLNAEAQEVQRRLSISLTSYEPLHNLQRQLQQATSSQQVEMALVVNEQGRVLASSNNALVDLSIAEVLEQPAQRRLRPLFRGCLDRDAAPQACLSQEQRLFLGPLPMIGGQLVLAMRQYPLAMEGMGGFGQRGSLITVTDARPAGREAIALTLWVFLGSLLPLMVGSAGLMLRLRSRLIPELLALAQVDALSGIYNRRAFAESAELLLRQAEAAALPMTLAVIDVDHFKQINDGYGHEAGDRVIQRVSELLRSAVRGADLVGRLGGDEFVILLQLPGEAATQACQRILETVRGSDLGITSDSPVRVTLSIGIAASRGLGTYALEALLVSADAALYVAKDRGRNQVVNLELEAQRGTPIRPRVGEWQIYGS